MHQPWPENLIYLICFANNATFLLKSDWTYSNFPMFKCRKNLLLASIGHPSSFNQNAAAEWLGKINWTGSCKFARSPACCSVAAAAAAAARPVDWLLGKPARAVARPLFIGFFMVFWLFAALGNHHRARPFNVHFQSVSTHYCAWLECFGGVAAKQHSTKHLTDWPGGWLASGHRIRNMALHLNCKCLIHFDDDDDDAFASGCHCVEIYIGGRWLPVFKSRWHKK